MTTELKPIRNEMDYETALAEIESLWGAQRGTKRGDRLARSLKNGFRMDGHLASVSLGQGPPFAGRGEPRATRQRYSEDPLRALKSMRLLRTAALSPCALFHEAARVAALLVLAFWASAGSAQTSFYAASDSEIAGEPGTLVRQEPMNGAPLGAAAYRVLYRSISFDGKPILVSGVVIVPQGRPPMGGRPIVAWAHPTSGIVPRCAPSLAIFFFQQVQGLRSLVEQGYVVAATDYPGLGTPGPHPYLVGLSEAHAVIDSVRVARGLPGSGEGKKFIVWGHSQGGQAALFTGKIAKTYAPDLTLTGVAAAAPATELATLMNDDIDSPTAKSIAAMTLWSWQRVFGAEIDKMVDPRAVPTIEQLAQECIEGPYDLIIRRRTEQPMEQYFLTGAYPADIEPWRSLLEKNTPGTLPSEIPVFLAQGTADPVILPRVTHNYAAVLCKAGSKVRFFTLPGVGHGMAARDSALAAVHWMIGRFAGEPPPDDCAH